MAKSIALHHFARLIFALTVGATASAHPAAARSADQASPTQQTEVSTRAKPKRPSAELRHMEKLDALLAPLKAYGPSTEDSDRIRKCLDAVRKKDLIAFAELRAGISDPVARMLVEWVRLRAGLGTAAEYAEWLDAHPKWPTRGLLVERMEEALFTDGGTAATIKSFFSHRPPETGAGYAALASAYLAEGNRAEAHRLAAKAWREMSLPDNLETGFLQRFAGVIDESDHKWRFDRLITDDVRYAKNRKSRATIARRLIPLLSPAERKKAEARLAVFMRSSNAHALIKALPRGEDEDWGLVFHRIQLQRKAGNTDAAAKMILAAPTDPKRIPELDEWWSERQDLAYDALKEGKYKLAYRLATNAGPLSVNPLKDQQFMAGWIALRYLKNPRDAERHFAAFQKAADGPLSRAKAAYWRGRAAEALGNSAAATKYYRQATRDLDTFHALLALQKLEPKRTRLTLPTPAVPTKAQVANFVALDLAKAAVLTEKAGLPRYYTRIFLVGLRNILTTEAEVGMVAHLADMLGDTQMSLRTAKAAIANGQNLYVYAYPLHPFPAFRLLRKPPELPLLLGIARQETEFDHQIISGAGAKGLLQVMTVTAKHVCRDYKIRCDIKRLIQDTSYNAMIASAYVADRMEDFSGSYVLGLAGYNAGPGRARQWIRENGDPRDPNVDVIDWIERIPITETRNYVTKVLANIEIYRARLGEPNPLRLEDDLERGRPGRGRTGRSHLAPGSASKDDG